MFRLVRPTFYRGTLSRSISSNLVGRTSFEHRRTPNDISRIIRMESEIVNNQVTPTNPEEMQEKSNELQQPYVAGGFFETSGRIDPNIPIAQLLDQDWSFKIPADKLHRFSIAPMLDVTHTHFRFLMRLLTRYSTLWTEMIHANSIAFNDAQREEFLRFHRIEHPVVLQFGGSDPDILAKASKFCETQGYDELNLNCGCPSERVQSGCFGAVLMRDPQKVAQCIKAIHDSVKIPAHVKCRIGVDDEDSYEFVHNFVDVVSKEGSCKHFIIHSRKCILQGLSPADNRKIPPLKYEVVKQLKKDFPHIQFSINGGIKTYEEIENFLKPEDGLTGVMVGRLAYEDPWVLRDVDRRVYGMPNPGLSRREILHLWGQYCDQELKRNAKIAWPSLTKPVINLFHNERNSATFRRCVSDRELYKRCKSFSEMLKIAVDEFGELNPEALDARAP